MTTAHVGHLLDWLRDAYAMEQQAEVMLKDLVERLEHYPQLRAHMEDHLEDTRKQQVLLKGCIERLGSSPSMLKDLMGRVMAFGQSVSGMAVSDEVVKGAMSTYVFTHMEIASYTILIAAARAIGDNETQRVCESILQQEIAMAEWLRGHLPEVTQAFLARSATPGMNAKR
ncbi:ferritin-like domain-containing protein [Cellvibrio sp. ARAG 10.3]|uniref:ferritin-like domain-containing protein n=1 Tax=Cellvibrio sp. ARAG 10.3 TaxID=3451358 RepID=UPI003F462FAE